ncbi:MAG: hypothetical protein AAGF47_01870 [Planctomycetota bacterium]
MMPTAATTPHTALRRRRASALAVLAMLAAAHAGVAAAQTITAETWDGSRWSPLPGMTDLPSGSDVTISLPAFAVVRVTADDPAATDVGVISVSAPPGVFPEVIVADAATPNVRAPANSAPAFRTVAGLIAPASVVALSAETLTGFGIEAREVVRVSLTGDLDAPIVHWGEPSLTGARTIRSIDIGGSITDRAPVVARDGRVGSVTVVGDVRSTLAAQHGGFGQVLIGGDFAPTPNGPNADLHAFSGETQYFAIERLDVDGTIGTTDRPAQITTGGPVLRIEADELHADINTMLDPSDPGFIGGIETRSGGFSGSLYARTLTSFGFNPDATCAIEINGDLDAFVFLENGTRNERADGPEIDIAGSVGPNAVLSIATMIRSETGLPAAQIRIGDADGVKGQVIVGNELPQSFEGDNTIVIGGDNPLVVTPATRFYTETADRIGGGAVGIAPFNFHTVESFPRHNETVELDEGERLVNAVLRLYGPVFSPSGQDAFIVEHLAPGASVWADRSDEFTAIIATEEAAATRRVDLTAEPGAHYEPGQWRIRPAEDRVRCAFVRDLPLARFSSEYDDNTYRFTVTGGCTGLPRTPGRRIDTGDDTRDTRAADIDGSISTDNDNGCP